MTVANVILFEFDTPEDLQKWADWARTGAGVFPENQILLFVKTGETSAIGIATYPNEEAEKWLPNSGISPTKPLVKAGLYVTWFP